MPAVAKLRAAASIVWLAVALLSVGAPVAPVATGPQLDERGDSTSDHVTLYVGEAEFEEVEAQRPAEQDDHGHDELAALLRAPGHAARVLAPSMELRLGHEASAQGPSGPAAPFGPRGPPLA